MTSFTSLFVFGIPGQFAGSFRFLTRWLFLTGITLALPAISLKAAPLTADDYDLIPLDGWTVYIEKSLSSVEYPRREAAIQLLRRKLSGVRKSVPAGAFNKLKQIPIWISRNSDAGAAYHPSAQWLLDNGRVVEMEKSIEIQNVDNFIDWAGVQPQMILHELAHAFHDRYAVKGFENILIRRAYATAVKSGDYRRVLYAQGGRKRHYALTNDREYFAECTEAYFGKNDFYPFNRKQFKAFDRAGYRMVERIWKVKSRR
jgi:hypothetical protein